LGANIDTQTVSSNYAISIDNARSYSTKGMMGTMRNLSEATTQYASSTIVGMSCNNVFGATGLSDADWLKEDKDDESTKQKIVDSLTKLGGSENV